MSDFPSLVSLPVPIGPAASGDQVERTERTVEATTCKIRGPFTNQPSKLGDDQFGRIDWILSNWDGATWEYAPKFEVEVATDSDHPKQTFISDYSKLRPYWKRESAQFGIADWTKESTSDHVPVIATCTYHNEDSSQQTIKVFQMNLLANGLCGDGFVKPINRSDTETVREPLVTMKKITTELLNYLMIQPAVKHKSLAAVAKSWTENKYPIGTVEAALEKLIENIADIAPEAYGQKFTEQTGDLTKWENFRDALLTFFPDATSKLIRDASIKDIDREMVFERARVLSKSILKANPDVLTLQENDMMYLLCDDNICPGFDEAYTCLVDQDSDTKQAYDVALATRSKTISTYRSMVNDASVAGMLKKAGSVPNGMLGFQSKLKEEATADRVDVHKDGVFVYVRKSEFVINSVNKYSMGTNDVPVVAALVQRRARPADRFYVISTHLTSGDEPELRMKEMAALSSLIGNVQAIRHPGGPVTNVILGMDANCDVGKIADESESKEAKQLLDSLPVVK
jgi:hypothetical protein